MLSSFSELLDIDFSGYNSVMLVIGGYTKKVLLPSIEILTLINASRLVGDISNTLVLCIDPQYNHRYLDTFLDINIPSILRRDVKLVRRGDEYISHEKNVRLVFGNFSMPTYYSSNGDAPMINVDVVNPIGMAYTKTCNLENHTDYAKLYVKLSELLARDGYFTVVSDALLYGVEFIGQNGYLGVQGRWLEYFCEIGYIMYQLRKYSSHILTNIPNTLKSPQKNPNRLIIVKPLSEVLSYWD
jgi:hypothetical protein